MFSANENIVLRKDKRRIIGYVEETIGDDVLDQGTTVMVMQVSCTDPGCVPLETIICIVFPKGMTEELIEGLPQSKSGGVFKTKILIPMSEVTNEDVLDALPPAFTGGRRSMHKLCLQARDVMLAQVTQMMEENDVEGKQLMANYLIASLQEYIDRGCVAPNHGEELTLIEPKKESSGVCMEQKIENVVQGAGNVVIRRKIDDNGE
jgi:hypothetical protein